MGRSELDHGAEGTEESVPERGTWCAKVVREEGAFHHWGPGSWLGWLKAEREGRDDKKAS